MSEFRKKTINQAEKLNLCVFLEEALYAQASMFERTRSQLPVFGGQIEARAGELTERCYAGDFSVLPELEAIRSDSRVSTRQKRAIKKVIGRFKRAGSVSVGSVSSERCVVGVVDHKEHLRFGSAAEDFSVKNKGGELIASLATKIESGNYYSYALKGGNGGNSLFDCLEDTYHFQPLANTSFSPTGRFFECQIERRACTTSAFGRRRCTKMSFVGKFDSGCFFKRACNETMPALTGAFPACLKSLASENNVTDFVYYVFLPAVGAGFLGWGLFSCIQHYRKKRNSNTSIQQNERACHKIT